MKSLRRILIYGSSIYILSLESNLRSLTGVETFLLNNNDNDLEESVEALDPDIIMIDDANDYFSKVLRIMANHPRSQVISMDKIRHTFTIHSSQSYPVNTMDDLVQALASLSFSQGKNSSP
jgi:hypothetical protein